MRSLRIVLGEFAGEVMASQRVVPRALVGAGFRFRHPDAASVTSWLAGVFGLAWNVDGFWSAVWGSIIISIVSFLLNAFLPDRKRAERP